MKKDNKNSIGRNILSALDITVFGFLLLNLTFLFDYFFQSAIKWIISLFTSVNVFMAYAWLPGVMHGLFMILIGFISWFILKSKIKDIYKAIFLTVPVAVIYVTIGIFLYRWPIVIYLLGALFTLGTFYYLYRTKQSWLYYYAVIIVGLTILISAIKGMQI